LEDKPATVTANVENGMVTVVAAKKKEVEKIAVAA
jgi:DNA-binding protein YbaB